MVDRWMSAAVNAKKRRTKENGFAWASKREIFLDCQGKDREVRRVYGEDVRSV